MKTIILFFLLFLLPASVAESNTCYQDAIQYQKQFGGSLVFVQPLTESGAWDLGRYNGHWMIYRFGNFLDPASGVWYNDPRAWFTQKSEYWILSESRPPFGLITD